MGIKQLVAVGAAVVALSEDGRAYLLKYLQSDVHVWVLLPELPDPVN